MKKSKVTITKDAGGYHAGDEVSLDAASAEQLVSLGYAEAGSAGTSTTAKAARGGGDSPSR